MVAYVNNPRGRIQPYERAFVLMLVVEPLSCHMIDLKKHRIPFDGNICRDLITDPIRLNTRLDRKLKNNIDR